ncbi:high frequency lysogenization protein HflD [Pseudofrankia sp. BMG5.37]|uniref:high frequency lysogenization protein HflD n=1 Tax=Pseudofrankia sp. BMG5.37 TaxID=3050035 RepID=UPI0028953647|nr:high frequency lysogenization protein HflD [Pseudofrankia sp. BMG5.37]MDT3440788.1 high frequency lysogenization protein HflD [Pseudofrankia sp. BMG5.37]
MTARPLPAAGSVRTDAPRSRWRSRRRLRRPAVLVCLVTFFLALAAGAASAHPLGSFTVNTASVLRVAPDRVRVDVVVDFAEIPATQLRPDVDEAGPAAWRDRECARVAGDLRVAVAGTPAQLAPTGGAVTFPPGQGGLSTMRLVCRYSTAITPGLLDAGGTDVVYALRAYTDRSGWRETIAVGDAATLVRSDVPDRSSSALLTAYPTDPLAGRSDVTRASLRARPGGPVAADAFPEVADDGAAGTVGEASSGGQSVSRPGNGGLTARFTGLVGPDSALTLGAAALALVVALGLGAAHAFAPGHGKTLMAAMIVGRRATGRQLAGMAGAVTLTHTLGVFLLAVTLSASAGLAPERLYPWLGAASGLLMIGLGLGLLRSRLGRGAPRLAGLLGPDHRGDDHTHGHSHGHHHRDHAHGHAHTHGADHDGGHPYGQHDHADDHTHDHGHGHHHHDHAYGRAHAHGDDHGGGHADGNHDHADDHGHGHGHEGDHAHDQVPGGGHAGHDRARGGEAHRHRHGGRWHSHAPLLAADGTPPRLRSLLLTGLAGGMVPTPSAVVVLLGAISVGRASFGVLLVIAYGLGMAATLVGVGYLLDRSLRPLLLRLRRRAPRLAASALAAGPVVSAVMVIGVGALLMLRAGMAPPA